MVNCGTDLDKPDVLYDGVQYKLRSGSPIPKGTQGVGQFYVHTFLAERYDLEIYSYTDTLPFSEDFRGQFGEYMSANFSRITEKGGNGFAGKKVKNPVYIDEDDISQAV